MDNQLVSAAVEIAASDLRRSLNLPADVDAVFTRLTDAGHPAVVKPFDAPWGQRYATVADPDGTFVDFYAPLPS